MTKPLWTSDDIALATGGAETASFAVTGTVSIDTRSLQPGDLFVALKDQRDGHDFVEAAFRAGAAGALVSRKVGEGPQVIVDDTLAALELMGIAARARCGARPRAPAVTTTRTPARARPGRQAPRARTRSWSC